MVLTTEGFQKKKQKIIKKGNLDVESNLRNIL